MPRKTSKLDALLAQADRAVEAQQVLGARDNLLDFTTYTFNGEYKVNWHHKVIADAATRFARQECRRLILCTPPQRGKSELISRRLIAYILGINPQARIIHCSYNQKKTEEFSDDVLGIIKSEEYHKVFPDIALERVGTGKKVTSSDWITTAGGTYKARGAISGGISGLSADYLILDDIIKGAEDARSDTTRESTWKWYTRDVFSRLNKNTCICLINTRWHVDDVTGRLLAAAREHKEADQWEVIEIREVREEKDPDYGGLDQRQVGDYLWESECPAAQGKALQIMDPQGWQAQYQQHPTPEAGVIIHKDWLTERWTRLPGQTEKQKCPPGIWVQSWDCRQGGRDKDSSYAVGSIWYRPYGDFRVFLVDLIRGRWSLTETMEQIKYLSSHYAPATIRLIEDKADGRSILELLESQLRMVRVTPIGSKEARLRAVSTMIEAGHLILPHREAISPRGIECQTWLEPCIQELITFPSSTNDDQVDVLSMALGWFQKRQNQGPIRYESVSKTHGASFHGYY